jgi:hypothetical protein
MFLMFSYKFFDVKRYEEKKEKILIKIRSEAEWMLFGVVKNY